MSEFTDQDYNNAISNLMIAGTMQRKPDGNPCAICEDSGHQAFECDKNPLVAMEKAKGFRCFHCGKLFFEAAQEHFGVNETETPLCIKQIQAENEKLEADLISANRDNEKLRFELDSVIEQHKQAQAEIGNLKQQYDDFFEFLQSIYEIETKEEFEELAKGWAGNNALMVAAFHTWKRNPKVEKLKADLEAAKKELAEAREELAKYTPWKADMKFGGNPVSMGIEKKE